jgi:hypothetical protein
LIPQGLVKVEGNTVIAANGERHEVDVIIWGTGFEVLILLLVAVFIMTKGNVCMTYGKVVLLKRI